MTFPSLEQQISVVAPTIGAADLLSELPVALAVNLPN